MTTANTHTGRQVDHLIPTAKLVLATFATIAAAGFGGDQPMGAPDAMAGLLMEHTGCTSGQANAALRSAMKYDQDEVVEIVSTLAPSIPQLISGYMAATTNA